MSTALCPPRSLFEEAIVQFRQDAHLTPEELKGFQMSNLKALEKQLGIIQQAQMNSRTLQYMQRIKPFLDKMEAYGKVIDIFVNVNDLVAFVWGPIKFILVAASSSAEAFEKILQAYADIGAQIPELSQCEELFRDDYEVQKVLAAIYRDMLDFHLEAFRFFRKQVWKRLFQACWTSLNSKIAHFIKNLEQHRRTLTILATLSSYTMNQEHMSTARTNHQDIQLMQQDLRKELLEIRKGQDLANAAFEEARNERNDNRLRYVRRWLGPTTSTVRHQEAVEQRHEKTGTWLLEHRKFKDWFDPDYCQDPLLWLTGQPGAGKTILSATIIEKLREHFLKGPHGSFCLQTQNHLTGIGVQAVPTAVIWYYCRYNDELSPNAFVVVIREMLSQLLQQDLDHKQDLSLLHYLHNEECSSSDSVLTDASIAESLLRTAIGKFDRVYIVLDGLDEYPTESQTKLTVWFRDLVLNLPTKDLGAVRCIFSCQTDQTSKKCFSNIRQMQVTKDENSNDIRSFCFRWHKSIEEKFKVKLAGRQDVAKIVTARAKGMFLYAKLVTGNLFEQVNLNSLMEELKEENFPQGLEQAYTRIMKRVLDKRTDELRNDTLRLLGWLACAKRHLRWFEIQGASAIDLDQERFVTDRKFPDESAIHELCGSLVEIGLDKEVRLVHYTLKEYLIRKDHIEETVVETQLATLCMGFLTFPAFESERSDDKIRELHVRGFFAFADYAVACWALHVEASMKKGTSGRSSNEMLQDLRETLQSFLTVHWNDDLPCPPAPVTTKEKLHPLRTDSASGSPEKSNTLEQFERMCRAVHYGKTRLRYSASKDTEECALEIVQRNQRIRDVFEGMLPSNISAFDDLPDWVDFYGTANLFKCPRLYCRFYHKGFKMAKERNLHSSKHCKAYRCPEEGCQHMFATIGCESRSRLQKHISTDHGIDLREEEITFPKDEKPETTTRSVKTGGGQIVCDVCNQSFTRANNLRVHKRKHTGERPFQCEECGSSFVKSSDLKRHQETHTTEYPHSCKIDTETGRLGCGKGFRRLDHLTEHRKQCKGPFSNPRLSDTSYSQSGSSTPSQARFLEPPAGQDTAFDRHFALSHKRLNNSIPSDERIAKVRKPDLTPESRSPEVDTDTMTPTPAE